MDFARTFWRAMAFPNVQDHVVLFGDADVAALRVMGEPSPTARLDESTVISWSARSPT